MDSQPGSKLGQALAYAFLAALTLLLLAGRGGHSYQPAAPGDPFRLVGALPVK